MLHGMLGLHTEACTRGQHSHDAVRTPDGSRTRHARGSRPPGATPTASGSARHVVFSSIRERNLIRRPQGLRKCPYINRQPLKVTRAALSIARCFSPAFCACIGPSEDSVYRLHVALVFLHVSLSPASDLLHAEGHSSGLRRAAELC